MSEYSSEPWKISDDGAPPCISDSDGNLVAEFVFTFNSNSYETELANGRRIVATVNACAGIPTNFLEGNPSSLESKRLLKFYAAGVERQRDNLLAAAKITVGDLMDSYRTHGTEWLLDATRDLRNAIAEVEASK